MSSLGELATYTNGRAFKKEEWKEQGLPIIRIQNLNDPDAAFNHTGTEHEPRHRVHHGDLLVSWAASLGAHLWQGGDAWLNQHIFRVEPREELVSKRYLFYALKKALPELYAKAHGSGIVHVTRSVFDSHQVPLAPREEQDDIVAEIEKQFSRLDEAVANLKRIKASLKRYKAAVLKAAVEGRLVPTEAELARREGRSHEAGAELRQRILQTRRRQWTGKSKYKEPAPPNLNDLPALPEGWTYATAEQLTDHNREITYGVIKLGEPVDGGVPVLRSSDVRSLRIALDGVKRISPNIAANYRRTFLEGGEVVMTVRGTLGGIAVVPPVCCGFNVSREVAMVALIEPEMAHTVAIFIASSPVQRWLMSRTKGIAYTGINIETLRALPIPIPPLNEQHRIVSEVDRRLSLVREIEAQVDANLKRARALKQATLVAALGRKVCAQRAEYAEGVPGVPI